MSLDKKVEELFAVVQKQKEEVEATEKETKQSWKTNCSFFITASQVTLGNPINIQTANEDTIRMVVHSILTYRRVDGVASKLLGVEPIVLLNGFSYDDWITDCKKRIALIQLRAKKTKLAQLEERLNAVVSPEQRRQMEIDAISKSLGL